MPTLLPRRVRIVLGPGGFRTAVLAALLVGILAMAAADAGAQPLVSDTRAKRRTPVVEVFETWKDAVVFVTGPVVKPGQPPTDEFFNPSGAKPREQNVGTGCVLHESGYVLTNAHAVEKLIVPVVALGDGRRFPAEVVSVLHQQDLALLKIEAGGLKAVRLGQSDDLMIGETVVVIGNPHGLLFTCTTGVVSAVGRASNVVDMPGVVLRDLIQSDAGVNPGSSGGPWFNIAGEMIGITSSMKRDAENIAFAISAASLRRALPGMLDVERQRGFRTGLAVVADGRPVATAVEPGSPAAQAGLKPGDVVAKVAGRPVPTSLDYHLALIGCKPGVPVALEVVRDGKPYDASLTPVARPKPDGAALLKRLGLTAVALDEATAKAMNLRVRRGVLLSAVDANRYEKLSHRPEPGDVLARIGAIRPRDLDHVGLLLENVKPGQQLALVFCRRKENLAVRIDMNLVVPP
ncbi:MAG: S1C family serine protease [Thermoguttaceae bacterium]|nr:S1C family serine protease [Thermoguttaceae bacterium]